MSDISAIAMQMLRGRLPFPRLKRRSIFAPLPPKGPRRPRVVLTTEEWVVRAPGSW